MRILVSLVVVTSVLSLIACALFLMSRKRQASVMTYLVIMLVVSVAADTFAFFAPKSITRAANIGGNIYTLVEISMIMVIYRTVLEHKKKWPVYLTLAALLGIQLYQMIIYPGIREFPSISRIATSVAVTVLSLLFFFKLIREERVREPELLPMFWVNVGMLVYFGCNIFLFAIRDYVIDNMVDRIIDLWILHNSLSAIKTACFVVGMWLGARRPALN